MNLLVLAGRRRMHLFLCLRICRWRTNWAAWNRSDSLQYNHFSSSSQNWAAY